MSSSSSSRSSSTGASNIIVNPDFSGGLASWHANSCRANVVPNGQGGNHAVVTDRKEKWQGLEQDITGKVSAGVKYTFSARVRVSNSGGKSHVVEATLRLEYRYSRNQYPHITKTPVRSNQWETLKGQFSLQTLPDSRIVFYLEGPPPGVDLLIDSVCIERAVRKRDVILNFSLPGSRSLPAGTLVKVHQIQNSFPIGSCITHTDIDKPRFVDFFVKHFNWAVFQYELKWDHTEKERGKFNYDKVDKLLDFCEKHKIKTRGHCILWEEKRYIQPWVRELNNTELTNAIRKRLEDLLTKYKGRFKHYDVNNEMLHETYYKDRLGNDIRVKMYKKTKELDPTATLFVNEYHIEEDGSDTEEYITHICDLMALGAPVEGVGIQGHVREKVKGETVCRALDKVAKLRLPIWFTELDFSKFPDEYNRADNLEVMLREAFAHPAVEGIVFWGNDEGKGKWNNAHWWNAKGDLNEAGKRLLALKEEWMSNEERKINDEGQFKFRGFPGSYKVGIKIGSKTISENFVVDDDKDKSPQEINISLLI